MRIAIVALLLMGVFAYQAAAAKEEAATLRQQVAAQAATIADQQRKMDEQVRRIYNLEGTVRDNLRTIQIFLGGHERPFRGNVVRRTFEVTAYTAADWPDNPAYGITASGHRLSEADAWKVAAADPRYYPVGTKVYIAGIGEVTVMDTGDDVKGPHRIDVFAGMENRSAALAYGRRAVQGAVIR